MHCEILLYLSLHFASTLAVLTNLMVPCRSALPEAGQAGRGQQLEQRHFRPQ